MKRLLLPAILLLSACDHYSEELASLDGKLKTGTPAPAVTASASTDLNAIETAAGGPGMYYQNFNEVLAQDYYTLARHENDTAMDYKAAQYYTQKAKAATLGKPVMPGNPNKFDIPPEQKETLTGARASLVSALETQRSPQNDPVLAKAVVCYDCWLDQAEEGKKGAAATCAESFNQAMGQLAAGLSPAAGGNMIAVPFLPNQTALAPGARAQVDAIIAGLQGTTPDSAKLFIDSEDTVLSRGRAAALRSVLQFNGVDPRYVIERTAASVSPVSTQGDSIAVSIEKTNTTGPGM